MLLAEWLGWRRSGEPRAKPGPKPRSGSTAATVSAVREALAKESSFANLGITVRAVAPGVIELAGWVDDRTTRGRVARFATSLPAITSVSNRILVHGEDDIHETNGHPTNSAR
jgi:osmotically-inducible protein OsmY